MNNLESIWYVTIKTIDTNDKESVFHNEFNELNDVMRYINMKKYDSSLFITSIEIKQESCLPL